jgi:Methyltransferase FkbM domain
LNSFRNIEVLDVALSNSNGDVLLHEGPDGHKGISSLRQIDNSAATIKVKTARLDTLASRFSSLAMVKIDVEGAEHLVLQGMTSVLKEHHPILVVEITDEYLKAFGHSAIDLCKSLVDNGYRMYRIHDDGLIPMAPQQAPENRQYNALFSCNPIPVELLAPGFRSPG